MMLQLETQGDGNLVQQVGAHLPEVPQEVLELVMILGVESEMILEVHLLVELLEEMMMKVPEELVVDLMEVPLEVRLGALLEAMRRRNQHLRHRREEMYINSDTV